MELKTYFAQDRAGNVVPNATTTIYLTGTNTLATGLKTVTDAALANPFTADANGKILFKAPDGIYDVQFSYGSQTGARITFQCIDAVTQIKTAQAAATTAVQAKNDTQAIINAAGEQSTLVALAQPSGSGKIGINLNEETYPPDTIGGYATLNFKHAQHIQHYFDLLGNWDDAIFQAQINVYLKGYSPKLILPNGVVSITRPILNGPALGDAIHAAHPELDFYNAATGKYKASWPLIIHGVYRKHQDGGIDGYNGSQILFRGCANRSDMTFTNWAIIHTGPNPSEIGQLRWQDTILKDWPGYAELRDFNIRAICKDGLQTSNIHGLYFHHGTQITVSNMSIYQCYGAGVAVDVCYDSLFENLKIMQCGRMSPVFGQYLKDGNLTDQYQTYAPIHVMRSPTIDNSNFIRFVDCHIEDNLHAAVDIIVTGSSSPVWLERLHVEAGSYLGGTNTTGERCIVGLGDFGVSYWGQESQPGYDYANRPQNAGGGYVCWHGGAMYSDTYNHVARLTRYTGLVISDMVFPNSAGLTVYGGNGNPYVYLSNVVLGDITYVGGNGSLSPLKMTNCKCASISMDYSYGPQLTNVDVTGTVAFTHMYSNNVAGGAQFTNCNFGALTGSIQYGSGNFSLNSTTVKSSFALINGHFDISRYAYYIANNLVGG